MNWITYWPLFDSTDYLLETLGGFEQLAFLCLLNEMRPRNEKPLQQVSKLEMLSFELLLACHAERLLSFEVVGVIQILIIESLRLRVLDPRGVTYAG